MKFVLIGWLFFILIFKLKIANAANCFKIGEDVLDSKKATITCEDSETTPNPKTPNNCKLSEEEKQEVKKLQIECNTFGASDLKHFENVVELTVISGTTFNVPGSNVFSTLKNLETINLSSNNIKSIAGKPFVDNTKLTFLDLQGNADLTRFDFGIFGPGAGRTITVSLPVSIQTLNINCEDATCLIEVPEKQNVLENIETLNASRNHFGDASKIMSKLNYTLQTMDLSYSYIETFDENLLKRVPKLSHLNLSHANISNIEPQPFKYQALITSLDLSHIPLHTIDENIIDKDFQELRTLNLEGNNLTNIDIITRPKFKNLERLRISKNDFTCLYLMDYLNKWENLIFPPNPTKNRINVNNIDCRTDDTCSAWSIITYTLVGILLLAVTGAVAVWLIYGKRIVLKQTGVKKPRKPKNSDKIKQPKNKSHKEAKNDNDVIYDDICDYGNNRPEQSRAYSSQQQNDQPNRFNHPAQPPHPQNNMPRNHALPYRQ